VTKSRAEIWKSEPESDKIKSGNMEIGTKVQAGMEETVNRASQEQWQNQDRKYENLLENACESRSNDK
jgi:hypothetical protein